MGTGRRRRRSQREVAREQGRRDPRLARMVRERRPELILIAFAVAVRLVYLVQSADIPSFAMPLVDSEVYDRAARALAAGDGLGEPFFFQPFLYPFVLGLIYLVTNGSVVAAKLVQAVLGAATCGLVAGLGERVADRRTGLVAGFITAIYGPLIFFESELLAAGWAAFFSVLLLLLFLAARDAPSARRLLGLGIAAGLALITRPTFLPFVGAAAIWLAAALWRRHGGGPAIRSLAVAVAGAMLVLVPVAAAALAVTGEAHVLPASGGLNLHLGNNAEPCETLTIRPGQEWHELVTAPMAAGAHSLWQQDRYFRAAVLDFIRTNPTDFVRGLLWKSLQMVSSREIPRNVDIYMFRRYSSLLAASVWKIGSFGFPAGVLLPLMAVGLVAGWRRVPPPLWLYLILYAAAVVLVFVSARYRVPMAPVAAIPAAMGALALFDAARARSRRLVGLVAVGTAAVLLAVLPGPFCQEEDLEGEYWFLMSAAELRAGDRDAAVAALERSVELAPGSFEARFQLGEMLLERGELVEAAAHLERAVEARPDLGFAHRELGLALGRSGRLDGAAFHLRRAVELEPDDPRALNFLGALLAQMGDLEAAVAPLERAVELAPEYPAARQNLDWVREQLAARDSG